MTLKSTSMPYLSRLTAPIGALLLASCVAEIKKTSWPSNEWTGAESEGKLNISQLVIPPGQSAYAYPEGNKKNLQRFLWAKVKSDVNSKALVMSQSQTDTKQDAIIIDYDGFNGGGKVVINKTGKFSRAFFSALDEFKLNASTLPIKDKVNELCQLIHKYYGSYDLQTGEWLSAQESLAENINRIKTYRSKLPKIFEKLKQSSQADVIRELSNLDLSQDIAFIPVQKINQMMINGNCASLLSNFPVSDKTISNIDIAATYLKISTDKNILIKLLNWARSSELISAEQFADFCKEPLPEANKAELKSLLKSLWLTELICQHLELTQQSELGTLSTNRPQTLERNQQTLSPEEIGFNRLICAQYAPILHSALSYLGIENYLIYGALEKSEKAINQSTTFRHLFVYIPSAHAIGEATSDLQSSFNNVSKVVWRTNADSPYVACGKLYYRFDNLVLTDGRESIDVPSAETKISIRTLLKHGEDPYFWNNHAVYTGDQGTFVLKITNMHYTTDLDVLAANSIWTGKPNQENGVGAEELKAR